MPTTGQVAARRGPAPLLWSLTAAGWVVLLALEIVPGAHPAHPAEAVAGPAAGPLRPAALAMFAGGWLVMVAAMMLPTTVPMARMFTVVSSRQGAAGPVRATFFAAYLAVWLVRRGGAGPARRHRAAGPPGPARHRPGRSAPAGRHVPVHPAQATLPDPVPRPRRVPVHPLPTGRGRGMVARRPARAVLPGLLLGTDADHVRHRRRRPGVDARADRGDGRREDRPLGRRLVRPVGVVLLLAGIAVALAGTGPPAHLH